MAQDTHLWHVRERQTQSREQMSSPAGSRRDLKLNGRANTAIEAIVIHSKTGERGDVRLQGDRRGQAEAPA